MDVIKGVFGEAEFRAMSDDMLTSFGRLLDDKLSMYLKVYMENENADQELVKRLKSLIGDKIEKCTFHYEVLERNLVEFVLKLPLAAMHNSDINLPEVVEKLTWLSENKRKLRSTIEPRNNKDYSEFLNYVKDLQKTRDPMKKEYDNIVNRVIANKSTFCAPNEKARTTRIGLLVSKSQDWEIALSGAEFLIYCNRKELPGFVRRNF